MGSIDPKHPQYALRAAASLKLSCVCDTKAERDHVVLERNCNYSAFNGYRKQWSPYSLIYCRTCGKRWRSKAAFVATLPDGKQ